MAVACSKSSPWRAGSTRESEPDLRWYVIRVKPHKETYVQMQLASCTAIETYCPRMKTPKKYLRRGQIQMEPVFPGYIFVRLDPRTQIFQLRRLHGYNALVSFDSRPATIPDETIRDFRRQEGNRGYIVYRPTRTLRTNDEVRIVDGPFRGQSGLFVRYQGSAERICLLMDFMNSQRALELPAWSVQAVAV